MYHCQNQVVADQIELTMLKFGREGMQMRTNTSGWVSNYTFGYNDLDLFEKITSPNPAMDAKLNSNMNILQFFEPFRACLALKFAKNEI